MARDYVDQVAASIIEQLRQGTAPWQKPWTPGERFMSYNPTSGNEYHGMNAVWLMSRAERHGYVDARWMTYRQAQSQDAQVRDGEKGTAIQFWKWQGHEPIHDVGGQPVLDENDEPVRRMVRYERPRVWSAAVFNAEQIDGLPPPSPRPVLAEWERHERADAILIRSGAMIRHMSGDRAFYRLAEDAITLPERGQFPSGDVYYATALHELGHNAAFRIMPHDRSDCPSSREPDLNDIGIKRRSLSDTRRCQFRIGLVRRKVRSVLQPERNDCDITIRDGRSGRLRGRVAATPSSAVRGRPQSPRLQVLDASPIRGSRVTLLCGGRGAWSRR